MATKIELLNEDCFSSMEQLSGTVNVILTSPPYNTARCGKTERSINNYENRYDVHFDDMTDDEYAQWTERLFNTFNSILKKNGVILYNISYGSENPNAMWVALEAIRKTNFMIADTIIWKKSCALPNNVSHNKLTRITEFIFVICRKDEYKTFQANKKVKSISKTGQKYYENIFNFIEAPNNDGSCALNKATFSSELVTKLLDIYANVNDVVYDPFMGTGTTAIGCLKFNNGDNNIKIIGSEISEAQVQFAKNRIDNFQEHGSNR